MRVLAENCLACHTPEKHKGGVVLATHEAATKEHKKGVAVVPGDAEKSVLIDVLSPGADPHMPPKNQLPADDIAALRNWVTAGAAWDADALAAADPRRALELRNLPSSYRPVLSLAMSPDQKRLAAGRGDEILLFDLESPDRPIVRRISTPREVAYALAWSADGKWLAAGGYRTIRVWDVQSSSLTPIELTGLAGRVSALAFAPTGDGVALIAGDGDFGSEGMIRQWRIPGATPLNSWVGHSDSVLTVKVSRDGRTLVSGGADKLVKIWERESGEPLGTLEGHAAQITALAISPNESKLATGSVDREIKIWDLKSREKVASYPPQPAGISDLAWLDDAKFLSACEDGVARIGAVADADRFERSLTPAADVIDCVTLSADGKVVYGGGHDGKVYVWTAASGAIERTLTPQVDQKDAKH